MSHAELWLDPDTRRLCGLPPETAGDSVAGALPVEAVSEPSPGESAMDVVEDALEEVRAARLLALGQRFFVRVPLDLPIGHHGALLLADGAPRRLELVDRRRLSCLAAVAAELVYLAIGRHDAAERAALFRLLAENATDTIVRGDLNGVRRYISPSVRGLLGYEPDELIGRQAIEITHPDDVEEFRHAMAELFAGRMDIVVSEQRQRRRDGNWVWLEALVKLTRDAQGQPDGYVASVRDISRRKAVEQQLAHVASHDLLTDLPNRVLLQTRLAQEISRARRQDMHFAVLALDLDRFKQVNDTYGHAAGDVVLRRAAERFRRVLRTEDLVARIGGDEFIVVQGSGGSGAEGAARLAARLIRAMAEPIVIGGAEIAVGLSVGAVIAPVEGVGPDGLLQAADQALYRAKQQGRGCWHIADATGNPVELLSSAQLPPGPAAAPREG